MGTNLSDYEIEAAAEVDRILGKREPVKKVVPLTEEQRLTKSLEENPRVYDVLEKIRTSKAGQQLE